MTEDRPSRLNVSERTSIPLDAILGRQRRSEIAAARHEAIWRIREATKWSLPRIGQFFGGRDHTTVLHSLRRMEDRAAQDPELRAYMDEIRQACSTQQPLPSQKKGRPTRDSRLLPNCNVGAAVR